MKLTLFTELIDTRWERVDKCPVKKPANAVVQARVGDRGDH